MTSTTTQRWRVLISNDDGIHAPGVITLAQQLVRHPSKYEIVVCCPVEEQSAQGHAITLLSSLWAERYYFREEDLRDIVAYKVDGTPADCVKIALSSNLLEAGKWRPHIVLSGINRGLNVGVNTIYSGTVAAAMEANMYGIPSIALSIHTGGDAGAVEYAALQSVHVLDVVLQQLSKDGDNRDSVFARHCINVNFPSVAEEEIKGWKLCPLGGQIYSNYYQDLELTEEEKAAHPHRRLFRIRGKPNMSAEHPDCDARQIFAGYITVTALAVSFETQSATAMQQEMRRWTIFGGGNPEKE